jgi:hypothetical protein
MLRKIYAAATVEAAKLGHAAPPLDPLFAPLMALSDATLSTYDEMFDEKYDGIIFSAPAFDCDPTIVAAAKAKTSPHIFSERQMRGARWDTPKQLEIAKMDRLGAKIDVGRRPAHHTSSASRDDVDGQG